MFYQKNSKALTVSAGGRVPAWQLPGERAACMKSSRVESRDIPISHSQRSTNRSSDAHPRDRSNQSAVRIPKNSRAAEPQGWRVGKYLVERIYREEGLTLQQRRKRRRRVAEHRRERFHPSGPNQVWSMDFAADQLADGRRFRSLTVVDIYTRECLAIESEQRCRR